jgi:hypothetical protein
VILVVADLDADHIVAGPQVSRVAVDVRRSESEIA